MAERSSTDSDREYDPTRDEPESDSDYTDSECEDVYDDELAADIDHEVESDEEEIPDPTDHLWEMISDFHADKRPHRRPPFTGKPAGIAEGVEIFDEQKDAFFAFYTETVVTALCVWCNKRAEQYFEKHPTRQGKVNSLKWKPVDLASMYIFLALQMVMGIHKLPRLYMYWSQHWMFGGPKVFCANVMSRN